MIEQQFTQPLLAWFDKHGRKNLPWQHPRSPYFVWLSEIMLQQTQVKTVIPYFNRFINRFPMLETLASASIDDVLALWSGLGYYSRARNLHRCAQQVMNDYHGSFPNAPHILKTLPGIGESTAAAIASLAYNQPAAILDGNVKRVLCRYFAIDKPPNNAQVKKELWHLAQLCMDARRCADYTQAIMDLGATCCTRLNPQCHQCPLQQNCQALQNNLVNQLPVSEPKKTKPSREGHFIVLRNKENAIFLQQNEERGIWGGLWCLPHFESQLDSHLWLSQSGYIVNLKSQPCLALKHSFTHFHLYLNVYHYPTIDVSPNHLIHGRWVHQEHMNQIGLPKPISVILTRIWQQETN